MSKRKEYSPKYWEKLLKREGLSEELPDENNGKRISFGDGLGRKTDNEEDVEDSGSGHSRMCPIILGTRIDGALDQPNDRPVEDR